MTLLKLHQADRAKIEINKAGQTPLTLIGNI